MSNELPEGFKGLAPFVEKWAHATEFYRARSRRESSPEELKAFYDAIVPSLPEIMRRIDEYPLGEIKGADHTLYLLALSVAEVAPHVEFYKCSPGVPFAFEEVRMHAAHEHVPD